MFLLKSYKKDPWSRPCCLFIFCRHQFTLAKKQEKFSERDTPFAGSNLRYRLLLELEADIYGKMKMNLTKQ